jgi:hypothetical protein
MSNTVKGLVSGFLATLVLSGVMLLRNALHLAPDFSLIQLLTRLGSMGTVQAWADHFIIGTVIWGLLYGACEFCIDKGSHLLKGLLFGVFAWLVMMVVFFPAIGDGLFGAKLGILAAGITLFYHLVYGVALGGIFGFLDLLSPAKADQEASPRA